MGGRTPARTGRRGTHTLLRRAPDTEPRTARTPTRASARAVVPAPPSEDSRFGDRPWLAVEYDVRSDFFAPRPAPGVSPASPAAPPPSFTGDRPRGIVDARPRRADDSR